MQLLPGLGRVKVRRIKDAFEKPFYPRSADGVSTSDRLTSAIQGKQKALSFSSQLPSQSGDDTLSRPPAANRPPSPVWDIELDLNEDLNDYDSNLPSIQPPPSKAHEPPARTQSPVWDIELDLNDSTSDNEGGTRKRKK